MNRNRLTYLLLCISTALTGACSLDYTLQECPYNVRFVYHTCDGRSRAAGNFPLATIRQLVYDEQNILVGEFANDTCQVGVGTLQLPPGNYTLVAWANAPDSLARMEHIVPGESHKDEGTLGACRDAGIATAGQEGEAWFSNTGRLYYGTLPFSVPRYGEALYNVGMMHAHARLNLTVEWADEVPAPVQTARHPVMTLNPVTTRYRLSGGTPWGSYHYPQRHPEGAQGEYRAKGERTAYNKIKASFVTFRLLDEVPFAVNLYDRQLPLMEQVELHRYFSVMGIGLNENLCQEFDLTLRISRRGTVIVETNVSGWEDGGSVDTQ